jgi:DNA-binding transcriptional MerR regulator
MKLESIVKANSHKVYIILILYDGLLKFIAKILIKSMRDLLIKKLYYSISEVSKITDIEQYVLRYWESEFEQLTPQKNRAGNRIYTNKDIRLILYIKELLREKKYTIEGAKKILEDYEQEKKPVIEVKEKKAQIESDIIVEVEKNNPSLKEDLEEIKDFLKHLLTKL